MVVNNKPIKPNRVNIILLGLFLAIVAAGGVVFMLEMLNQRIRGKGAFTALLGQSPLVEIPYITTTDEYLKRKNLLVKGVTGLVRLERTGIHFL